MILPSEKLLSAVLGYAPHEINGINSVGGVGVRTLVLLNEDSTVRAYTNIYELMHLMKEWANNMKITIDSGYDGDTAEAQVFYKPKVTKYFHSDTEFEVVTKACEWILEQQ